VREVTQEAAARAHPAERARAASAPSSPVCPPCSLQRTAGNAAVVTLLSRQARLQRTWGCGPQPRPARPAAPVRNVWAEQREGPRLAMCADPHGGGEPGWDAAADYSTLSELAETLRSRVVPGNLVRLAISAHGDRGALYLEGPNPAHALSLSRLQAVLANQRTNRDAGAQRPPAWPPLPAHLEWPFGPPRRRSRAGR
jgi:hypothetical protein